MTSQYNPREVQIQQPQLPRKFKKNKQTKEFQKTVNSTIALKKIQFGEKALHLYLTMN